MIPSPWKHTDTLYDSVAQLQVNSEVKGEITVEALHCIGATSSDLDSFQVQSPLHSVAQLWSSASLDLVKAQGLTSANSPLRIYSKSS